jgi:CheY-like chemotaxis protein
MSPVDVFCSYSHRDEDLRQELVTHLALLQRRNVIRLWHDRALRPGDEWRSEIANQLQQADLILLLVSADFVASDFVYREELQPAIARHRAKDARCVPIIIRATDWKHPPLSELQALPTDGKPVMLWANRDEAWVDVVVGIRKEAEAIIERPERAHRLERRPPPSREASEAIRTMSVNFASNLTDLMRERRLDAPNESQTQAVLNGLMDVTEQKCILWVDDHPENNQHEISWLRQLQVQVITATSTDEALVALSKQSYHLIISDWQREPTSLPGVSEGLRLLLALHSHSIQTPVVYYYGAEWHEAKRAVLRAAGALGATYRPDELYSLVASALQTPSAS